MTTLDRYYLLQSVSIWWCIKRQCFLLRNAFILFRLLIVVNISFLSQGFVTFDSYEAAEKAIEEVNGNCTSYTGIFSTCLK